MYSTGIFGIKRLSVPVISVGNLSVGGTGKTPLVAAMITILRRQNRRPGILTRGYGRKTGETVILTGREKNVSWNETGDEPAMLYNRLGCPMGIGADRFQTGTALLAAVPVDCLVLDDGFQHWRIFRQADLVMVDGFRPVWQDRLLPAGRLREPVSAMERADAIVAVGPTDKERKALLEELKKRWPDKTCFEAETKPEQWLQWSTQKEIPLQEIQTKRMAAFAGIANPERFEQLLLQCGVHLCAKRWFADHHAFSNREIEKLFKELRGLGAEYIVTTEKDALRLKGFALAPDLAVLRIKMNILDEEAFGQWLHQKIQSN